MLCCSVVAEEAGEKLFKKVDPVVVAIQHERAGGSGFIIDPKGYILTNGHVVSLMDPENPKATAKRITVILHNEKKYQAKVIGFSLDPDVALIKIEPEKPLVAAVLGDSTKVKTGQTCYAFGAPLGLKKTLTKGIISNTAQTSLRTFTKVFQMDAIINSGNSGGPLFNAKGEVISINTYGGRAGLGFSIPINYGKILRDHYKKFGKFKRSDLPFFVSKAMTEDFAKHLGAPQGVFVDYVVKDSVVDKAGLKTGDIIVGMNGEKVSGKSEEDYYDWTWKLTVMPVGAKVELDVLRKENGKYAKKKISANLIEDEPAPAHGYQIGELKEVRYGNLGLGVQKITRYGWFIYRLPTMKGVRVTSVESASVASEGRLTRNSVITSVNGKAVNSDEEFKKIVDGELKSQTKFLVLDVRRGNDIDQLVLRPRYSLSKLSLAILTTDKTEYLEVYKRRLEIRGASVNVIKSLKDLQGKKYHGLLLTDIKDANSDSVKTFFKKAADDKLVIGAVGKAPLALINAPKVYSEKKMTMEKEVSCQAIKKDINYTGKEVESDGLVVTSTGFDSKTAKTFIEVFAGVVSRKAKK